MRSGFPYFNNIVIAPQPWTFLHKKKSGANAAFSLLSSAYRSCPEVFPWTILTGHFICISCIVIMPCKWSSILFPFKHIMSLNVRDVSFYYITMTFFSQIPMVKLLHEKMNMTFNFSVINFLVRLSQMIGEYKFSLLGNKKKKTKTNILNKQSCKRMIFFWVALQK